jgi:putative transcriptional regulator
MFKKGDLLISEPFLPDPNFVRSVILLAEHEKEGSLGFVLNQQSDVLLEDLGDEFQNIEVPVYIGGPVEQNTLHFIHTSGDKIDKAVKITDQFYWNGDLQQMLKLIRLGIVKSSEVRFFLGYSGWGEGQLKSEMDINTWILVSDDIDELLDIESTNLWREILRRKGGKLKEISNYPIDPRLN